MPRKPPSQRTPDKGLGDFSIPATPQDGSFPLVSIIIPFVNDRAHLPRTLRHLAQLDYPVLEFIFVNDASSDGSVDLVASWIADLPVADAVTHDAGTASATHADTAATTPAHGPARERARERARQRAPRNWTAHITEASRHRVGVALAREHGLAQAHGEWVWFCDSDDTFLPSIISCMVTAATGTPQVITRETADSRPRIDMVACRAMHIEPNGRRRVMEGFDSPTLLAHRDIPCAIAAGHLRGYLWNKLFRKELLDAAVGDIEEYCAQLSEDSASHAQGKPHTQSKPHTPGPPPRHPTAPRPPLRLSSQSDFMMLVAAAGHSTSVLCMPNICYFYRERAASISTGSELKISNTARCAQFFTEYFTEVLSQNMGTSRDSIRVSEYFRTWFYRVPCFTTPTHQRWQRGQRAHIQAGIRKELSWSGLYSVAVGIPRAQLPAMPRIAVHGAAQKILGPVGLYGVSYRGLRAGIRLKQVVIESWKAARRRPPRRSQNIVKENQK